MREGIKVMEMMTGREIRRKKTTVRPDESFPGIPPGLRGG